MGIKAKEKKVFVGDKELIVKEMVLSQRDFLFQKLHGYNLAEMLYKNKANELAARIIAKTGEPENDKISARTILEAIQEIIIKLGSQDLTELIINVLNIKSNREIVGIDQKDAIPLQIEKMTGWIKENMTWTQEPEALKAILEVNDIGGILKNYMEIGGQLSGLFQSKKQSPESPQKSEQTPK